MKKGYVNGSDLLIKIAGKYVGHCTSHSVECSSETKDRAVKPAGTVTDISDGLWKEKGITGLSISASAEGICNYDETEGGYAALLAAWKAAEPVECEFYERGETEPYLKGKFVITSLSNSAPAGDDATYSISLENCGKPDSFDTSKLTVNEAA